jgi:hypothetical protein
MQNAARGPRHREKVYHPAKNQAEMGKKSPFAGAGFLRRSDSSADTIEGEAWNPTSSSWPTGACIALEITTPAPERSRKEIMAKVIM